MALSFDNYQFENPRRRGDFSRTSARAGVASNEFAGTMRTVDAPGRTRRWIPAFAHNDGQLRSVMVHVAIGYIFRNKKVPADIQTDLAYLKRMAQDRQRYVESLADGSSNEHWNHMAQHIRAVSDAGGYLPLVGAVSYRSWRLRWHDRDVAAELGITPTSVKDLRTRMLRYAERLGYPTFPRRKNQPPRASADLIASMWKNTATVDHIAAILGCSPRFVRHLLRTQGLYVHRQKRTRRGVDVDRRRDYMRDYQRNRREQQFLKTVAWG